MTRSPSLISKRTSSNPLSRTLRDRRSSGQWSVVSSIKVSCACSTALEKSFGSSEHLHREQTVRHQARETQNETCRVPMDCKKSVVSISSQKCEWVRLPRGLDVIFDLLEFASIGAWWSSDVDVDLLETTISASWPLTSPAPFGASPCYLRKDVISHFDARAKGSSSCELLKAPGQSL